MVLYERFYGAFKKLILIDKKNKTFASETILEDLNDLKKI